MNMFGIDYEAVLNGLMGHSRRQESPRNTSALDALIRQAFASQQPYGAQAQQRVQGLGAQHGNQARNTMNLFSGVFGGLGPVMKHPTEREIAIAELKECLGEELWDLAPIS